MHPWLESFVVERALFSYEMHERKYFLELALFCWLSRILNTHHRVLQLPTLLFLLVKVEDNLRFRVALCRVALLGNGHPSVNHIQLLLWILDLFVQFLVAHDAFRHLKPVENRLLSF